MKLKNLAMIVAITIIVLSLIGCGKGYIIGKITDENNDPISGAQVITDPPTFSKLSSVDGYEMKGVPVGVYTITATKVGYSKKDVEIKVFKNRATQADIQLKKLTK